MVTTLIDISGQRFGKMTVLSRAGTIHGQASWLCRCDCGNMKAVRGHSLRNGETTSCGCVAAHLASMRLKTHGMSKTRLFKIWSMMKERCYKTYHKSYADYGGRGISICDAWRNDFSAFADWALLCGYSDNLTIDRIDVDGDYCPENCRWSTAKEQANNRRSSRVLTYNNQSKTVSGWADEYKIKQDTLLHRIKSGWDIASAISTPVEGRKTS